MKNVYSLLNMLLILSVFNSEASLLEKEDQEQKYHRSSSFTLARTRARWCKVKKSYEEMKKMEAYIDCFEVMTGKKTLVLSSYIIKELDKADQIKRLQFKNRHRITSHAQTTIKTRCSGTE